MNFTELHPSTLSMQYGQQDFAEGAFNRARRHFIDAYESGGDSVPIKAARMVGVLERSLGQFEHARVWFGRALHYANRTPLPTDYMLRAAIFREKAITYHEQLFVDPTINKDLVTASAEDAFEQSMDTLNKHYKPPYGREEFLSERHATKSAQAYFLFQTQRRKIGLELLMQCKWELRKLQSYTHEFDNLLRLMHVKPSARMTLLPRALYLIHTQQRWGVSQVTNRRRLRDVLFGRRPAFL